MVAFKALLVVAVVVSVAFVQINGKPAELKDPLFELSGPIQEMLQNASNAMSKVFEKNVQYTNTAKKSLNDVYDRFMSLSAHSNTTKFS